MARLEVIDQRVKAQMRAEAHDRIGQSMALAALFYEIQPN